MQISRLTPTGSGKSANCQQLRNPGANSLDLLNDPAVFYTTDIVKYFQNFCISFSHTNSIFSKNIGFSRGNTTLNSFIALSTGLLKSSEFVDTLAMQIYIILHFYFEQKRSMSLALRQGHFRSAGISF